MSNGLLSLNLGLGRRFTVVPLVLALATTAVETTCFAQPRKPDKDGWISLMPSPDFREWEKTNFGGEGEIVLKEGAGELIMDVGQPLTGVTYREKFPKENFEIRWEASRLEGSDFLAGLTFPVGEEFCSFICGGWGGGLIGLSSIDGNDASENETSQHEDIKNGKWYRFLVRVDSKNITVTMDDKKIIETPRDGKAFSVRGEVRANRPMGYCVFQSKVAIRKWEYRTVDTAKKP
jgi:hypothetical protein